MFIAAIAFDMPRLLSDRPGIAAPVIEIRDVNHRFNYANVKSTRQNIKEDGA